MDGTKIFRPKAAGFIVGMTFGILIVVLLSWLFIVGIIQLNWFYIILCIVAWFFMMPEIIKSILWKVVFTEDHIDVPANPMDRYMFGTNRIQKIYYSEIEELKLLVWPLQVLSIKCRGENEPNKIYVKQFTRGQAYKMIDEINLRAQKHSETFIPFDVNAPHRKRVNKRSGRKRA